MTTINLESKKLQEYLGMKALPVGIKLYRYGETVDDSDCSSPEDRATFCRFVHEAANGRNFVIRPSDNKCTNAELTLGLREPRYGDVEFRIKDKIAAIRIGPLQNADVVMLILNPEQLMSAGNILENINLRFRKNRAVCGDGVTEVYNSGQPRISFLCIGSRTDGRFADDELLLSVPYKTFLELPAKTSKFASLSRKAKDNLSQRILSIH